MAEEKVKLTVRLPKHVHQALKERAVEYDISLNQALVDALETELTPAAPVEETEGERVDRVLREVGCWPTPVGWMNSLRARKFQHVRRSVNG